MDRDSTTAKIIAHLLSCQSIKADQNVKHKLHEFVVKYGMSIIEESMKYAGHAGKDFVDGEDVR